MFLSSIFLSVTLALPALSPAAEAPAGALTLHVRSRVESPAASGQFAIAYKTLDWAPTKTAVVVCDMWDRHRCAGAAARLAELAPRVNDFIVEARKRGVLIVHAPSGCMEVYAGQPARKRAQDAPDAKAPAFLKQECRGLDVEKQAKWPIDDSDGGCDCTPPCTAPRPASRQQIGAIKIDDRDAISDSGIEIGNLFVSRGIENVMLVGVHENMCVLVRPFGLRNMVRWGKNVLLVRDLTDSLYNPRMRPRVSHVRGTELVLEHIERYVCPSIDSSDLLGGPAFRLKEDKRPHVAFVSAENQYFSERTLPEFGQMLTERCGCYCTMALGDMTNVAGLDELKTADVAVVYARRLALPKAELDKVRAYLDAGKPLVGLRTCSHAFVPEDPKKMPPGSEQWPEFDHDVLGGHYHGHFKNGGAEFHVVPEAAGHPILAGVKSPWITVGTLYWVSPIAKEAKVLVTGIAEGQTEPVVWTHAYKNARIVYIELGHQDDFAVPQFRTLLVNSIFWAMNRPAPAK
jgi:type 1 glutamine amidotransferase/nicotinamidase-related amidase